MRAGRARRAAASPALTHPDVVLVAGGASVDEIRDVLRSAAFRPFEGRRRVFILDEADTLSAVVQNALLKTLEEPGATSQFILVLVAARRAAAHGALALPDAAIRAACRSIVAAARWPSSTGATPAPRA